jgi:class 3 adenylate cyclase
MRVPLFTRQGLKALLIFVAGFLITLAPLVMLGFQRELEAVAAAEAIRQGWFRQAQSAIEDLKAGSSFQAQIDRAAFDMTAEIEKSLPEEETAKDEFVTSAFLRFFDPHYSSSEFSLYAISIDASGNHRLLQGDGLTRQGGAITGEILKNLSIPEHLTAASVTSLNRRVRGVFGDSVDFELLAQNRRGRVTPVFFRGENSHLIWNKFVRDGKVIGAFLAVFPESVSEPRNALRHAARRINLEGDLETSWCLVPIEAAKGAEPLIADSSKLPGRLLRSLRVYLQEDNLREDRFPMGRVTEFEGFWLVRDLVSLDLPYEIWLLRPGLQRDSVALHSPFDMAVTMVFFCFWALYLARWFVLGYQPRPGVKGWFVLLLVLAGFLPLMIFYNLGKFLIESRVSAGLYETVEAGVEEAEALDHEIKQMFSRYERVCREIFQAREFRDIVANVGSQTEDNAFEDVFSRMASHGFPLRYIFVIPFKGDFRSFDPQGNHMPGNRFMGLFHPWSVAFSVLSRPILEDEIIEALSGEEKVWFDFFCFAVHPNARHDLFTMRDQGGLYKSGQEVFLNYFNMVYKGLNLAATIVFMGDTERAFERHVFNSLSRLDGSSGSRFRAGISVAGGVNSIWKRFGDRSDLAGGQPDRLWQLMGDCARRNARTIKYYPDRVHFAYPCSKIPGFVIGTEISLAENLAEGRRGIIILNIATLLMAIMMVSITILVGRHFMEPLRSVANSLQMVGMGDLDTRLNLARPDEIGDVAKAFDDMIEGLNKRVKLGKLVSQSLDTMLTEGSASNAPVSRQGVFWVSDIRSFTTISEAYPAEEVVSMLNDHLDRMSDVITGHGATVERFVGDAVYASFIDEKIPVHEVVSNALDAALEIVKSHKTAVSQRLEEGKFEFRFGIGIDFGCIISGAFGDSRRMEYGFLGECVSKAEKLEQLSKGCSYTGVAVSEAVVELAQGFEFVKICGGTAFELTGRREESC